MHDIEAENDLTLRINRITLTIQERYPELYRNLNEMYATLPIADRAVINKVTLTKWLESLNALVAKYDAVH